MKLLAWGANTYSQLGHGVKSEQCVLPIEVSTEDSLFNPADIVSIVGGGGHSLLLNNQGVLFGCGWNNKGQLGFSKDSEVLTFRKLTSLSDCNLKQVACGWDSCMAITHERKLLAWGSNVYGQLGVKKKVAYSSVPLEVPVPTIKHVSCGLRHSAMATEDGQVLVCGNGRKGQLGLMNTDAQPVLQLDKPHIVPGLNHIRAVSCGQHHTIALTADGHIFGWGDNSHGQLGLDPKLMPALHTPLEIYPLEEEALPSNCKIMCGWTHTVLLTENGEIINWGRNTYGQLGCSEFQRSEFWKPEKLVGVGKAKQISVGSEHNIALMDSGQVLSWGWNEHGNCGTGTELDVTNPSRVGLEANQKAVLIGSGGGHSFALVKTM